MDKVEIKVIKNINFAADGINSHQYLAGIVYHVPAKEAQILVQRGYAQNADSAPAEDPGRPVTEDKAIKPLYKGKKRHADRSGQ